MRSLFAILAALLLFGGCRSDETPAAPDTIATETTATVVSTTEFPPATGTIVELPSESPVPPPASQTAPTTQAPPPTQAAPAATPAPDAKPPAQRPAQPAPTASAPPRSEPAPQPAPRKPALEPSAPAAKEPAPEPQPEPEAKAPAPAPATKAPSRLPRTHTVDQGGAMHAPGFETPAQRCAGCHGKDLKGGKAAPSCFSCHDQVW